MRVLMGMPDAASLGGPAACEPPFVQALREAGVETAEETYVYGDQLTGTRFFDRVLRVLRISLRLRRRTRETAFDVVHLNTSFDSRASLRDFVTLLFLTTFRPRAGRAGRTKIFLKFHGSDADLFHTRNRALRFVLRFILRRADAFGVLSSEERENFLRAGVDARKIFVVKNAVVQLAQSTNEANITTADDSIAFARRLNILNISPDVPRLLFIARFIEAKGLLNTIRACKILRDESYDFVLLAVGDGATREAAEREVARCNLAAQVRFIGFISEREAADFYRHSTLLVFPTYHYEGFPMTIFNSVAAGLPVITTRIRAAADYLREPDNCLWVEPRNPEHLAVQIKHLLADAGTRDAMRCNNLKLAEQFTAEKVAAEYVDVYKVMTNEN